MRNASGRIAVRFSLVTHTISGGPNSRRAVKLAVDMASAEKPEPALVTALHIVPFHAKEHSHVRGSRALEDSVDGIDFGNLESRVVQGADLGTTILEQAEGYDLIVLAASDEPVFKNLLVGTMTERVARQAKVTVMMVKRRSTPLHSFVRQALLEPTVPKPLD
ncbi:MAG: universal stress protein [Anaerolineales bacterium]